MLRTKSIILAPLMISLGVGAVSAADLIIPTTPEPIYEAAPSGFDWNGLYVGIEGGGQFAGETNGVVGAVAGFNFMVSDSALAGVELQGDYVWNGDDFDATEFLASGRVGAIVTDSVLAYAKAGVGYRDPSNDGNAEGAMYAFGGGLEVATTEAMSVRGEVLGQGFFGDDAPNDGGFTAAKATVGVLFHF